MPREIALLRNPPVGVLGTMEQDHESNLLLHGVTLQPVRDPATGDVVRVRESQRGRCILTEAMNATAPDQPTTDEASLRHRVRTALDRAIENPRKVPFTKRESSALLLRLLVAAPKLGTENAEVVEDARRYLVAHLGGDEAVAALMSIWEPYLPKLDQKIQDRIKQEEKALESIPECVEIPSDQW